MGAARALPSRDDGLDEVVPDDQERDDGAGGVGAEWARQKMRFARVLRSSFSQRL